MSAPDRTAMLNMLYGVIDSLNSQLAKSRKLEKSADLVVVGPSSAFDSLMLMNMVVETEGRLQDEFGVEVSLADLMGLPIDQNPFRTLGTLADYLAGRATSAA